MLVKDGQKMALYLPSKIFRFLRIYFWAFPFWESDWHGDRVGWLLFREACF
jgi:hypothetical protein